MERYVNDGSPSGFTEKHRTKGETDPFGLKPWFHPFYFTYDEHECDVYGNVPTFLPFEDSMSNRWFIIHPDMANHEELASFHVKECEKLKVVPTSSARTVQLLNPKSRDYLKLHYDGIIGRINRKFDRMKAISGVEMSNHLEHAINSKILPDCFGILREIGAKVIKINLDNDESAEWGLVWRKSIPHTSHTENIDYLMPLFSLWSFDRLSMHDPVILDQLCLKWGKESRESIVEKIITPIIACYFELLVKLGFQVELNAQNILIGFDKGFIPNSIIFRDLMGVEKDLPLRKILGLGTEFDSWPYKCIYEEMDEDPEVYKIRHSFSYDFKLCQYIIEPLVYFMEGNEIYESKKAIEKIVHFARRYISQLPKEFFPKNGKWYIHDRILIDSGKPFVAKDDPKFR
jgi:hypothetical protein